ncbi:MAG: hypothetical protein ABI273_11755 [Lacunisphaera sp.]
MRVSYLGTSGAACGYEYRFSPAGAVTFVGTYLKERPGDLIVIYDPHRQIDVRGKYRNVITRYAPLTSDKEAESGRGGN